MEVVVVLRSKDLTDTGCGMFLVIITRMDGWIGAMRFHVWIMLEVMVSLSNKSRHLATS